MSITYATSEAERRASLLHLYGIWPDEVADRSLAGRRHLVTRMERILRDLRQQGLNGHFAYSLAEHRVLLRILEQERSELLADA